MRKRRETATNAIIQTWKEILIGQDHAIEKIAPYVVRAKAGLNAPNRPLGVFFLMGPTGTGKTRTAESLAEVLHGDENKILRIDCGEFQLEHEVSKLIGSPPGYLGHRETQPIITTKKMQGMVSEKSDICIVLFDEVEKAHPSMWRLLLGVLDKAILRLGDNTAVDFQRTLIFMSSNVGAKEIDAMLHNSFGFVGSIEIKPDTKAVEKIGLGAMGKKFPPEFPNRIDEILTYKHLEHDDLKVIASLELGKMRGYITSQMGTKAFLLLYEDDTVDFITKEGTSIRYGARELKRAITRHLLNPLADDVVNGKIPPGATVACRVDEDDIEWDVHAPSAPEEDSGADEEETSSRRRRKSSASSGS